MKRLLLVDDNIHPFRPVVRALEDQSDWLELRVVETLGQAVEAVTAAKSPFDGYLIDLEMPLVDVPKVLVEHVRLLNKAAPDNVGQAFAGWLRTYHRNPNYAYFTTNLDFLNRGLEPDPSAINVIAKGSKEAAPDMIVATVRTLFKF
jgi:hypothetical protein